MWYDLKVFSIYTRNHSKLYASWSDDKEMSDRSYSKNIDILSTFIYCPLRLVLLLLLLVLVKD